MKILIICENYIPHYGGAEVVLRNLAEGFVKKGHSVNIITHKLKNTKSFEIMNGVKVHRIRTFDSRYLFTFFAIPKAIKLAKKADIIQTTTFNATFPSWLAGKIKKKPVILMVLEVWAGKWKELTEMNWFSATIHDILERMIYFLKFDKYTCISESTQKQLLKRGVKKSKTEVIYCGIDYNVWNPHKFSKSRIRKKLGIKKNFVYMFTGRPGTSKGLEYLIKAVPYISKQIPNAKLLAIVSTDPAYKKKYNQLIRLIKKLKIQDKVKIIKPVPYRELPGYIQAADCVVIPSIAEGFGFTTVEACAMKKPVVATDVGSLPEVVSGKYVLIKPRSSNSISKGIVRIYNKNVPKTKIKQFTIKSNIEKYLQLYDLLLNKKQ